MCNPSHTAGGMPRVHSDGTRHISHAQGIHPEEGTTMAIILIAQFITVCSATNLAEARPLFSPVQGPSPAKT